MKFRISLLLLTLALAASSTLTAHAACNNLTIKGTYAFTIHGTVFLPGGFTLLIDGIDKVERDTAFDNKDFFSGGIQLL